MPAIGYVQRQSDGSFKGSTRRFRSTPTFRSCPIAARSESSPTIGSWPEASSWAGGWVCTGEVSQREYVRLAMSAPELGPRTLYANLGRGAGQDDDDAYAIMLSQFTGLFDQLVEPVHEYWHRLQERPAFVRALAAQSANMEPMQFESHH